MTLYTSDKNSLNIEKFLLILLQFRPCFQTEEELDAHRKEMKLNNSKYTITIEVKEIEG